MIVPAPTADPMAPASTVHHRLIGRFQMLVGAMAPRLRSVAAEAAGSIEPLMRGSQVGRELQLGTASDTFGIAPHLFAMSRSKRPPGSILQARCPPRKPALSCQHEPSTEDQMSSAPSQLRQPGVITRNSPGQGDEPVTQYRELTGTRSVLPST